jgi:hypothetical protein
MAETGKLKGIAMSETDMTLLERLREENRELKALLAARYYLVKVANVPLTEDKAYALVERFGAERLLAMAIANGYVSPL